MSTGNAPKGVIIIDNPFKLEIAEWPFDWRVPSRSRPGVTRLVKIRVQRCDCEAGRFRKPCRHVRLVNDFYRRLWIAIADRMTASEPGWKLLRQIEGLIELKDP